MLPLGSAARAPHALAMALQDRLAMRWLVLVGMTGCLPAVTATPQTAHPTGRGNLAFAMHHQFHTPSFAAGRGPTAPRATAGTIEDDEAIHNGGVMAVVFGLTDDVDLELFGSYAAIAFPNGGGAGVRARIHHDDAIEVAIAGRAGAAAGTGGNASDSASEFDGSIPQPLARIYYAQAAVTAQRASGVVQPIASLSVTGGAFERTVSADPDGSRAATRERYVGLVTTATVGVYFATSAHTQFGPFGSLGWYAMPSRDGGSAFVPSWGLMVSSRAR